MLKREVRVSRDVLNNRVGKSLDSLFLPPSLRGPGLVSSKAPTMLHRVRFRGRRSGRAGTGNQAGNAGRVGGVREHACGSEDLHRGDDAGHYRDGQGALLFRCWSSHDFWALRVTDPFCPLPPSLAAIVAGESVPDTAAAGRRLRPGGGRARDGACVAAPPGPSALLVCWLSCARCVSTHSHP